MRKGKFVAVLSAGLLTVSAFGGTAFAHWGGANSEDVQEKIAEELQIDALNVTDAFATATDEARDAAIAERLARLVEEGVLTQAEADEVQAWYDSAPDAVGKLPIGKHGRADLDRVAEILGVDVETLTEASRNARETVALEAYQARLDEAVAEGRITQEQADLLMAHAELNGVRGFGHGHGHHGRGHHGGFGHQGGFGHHDGMRGFGWSQVPDTTSADVFEMVDSAGQAA